MRTYSGFIKELPRNGVFVFGSNPEGRHGAGAAKLASQKYGAIYGVGRGLQGRSYGLVTKNLTPNYTEVTDNGEIFYKKAGMKSVSKKRIIENINELYEFAEENPDKLFYIAYTLKGNLLNGYTSQEMANMFNRKYIPENIVFEDKFSELM